MYGYRTKGVCSTQINFDVDKDNKLTSLEFVGGCPGNARGMSKLAIGKHIDTLIQDLEGIQCRGVNSCPDQLAQALKLYKSQQNTTKTASKE